MPKASSRKKWRKIEYDGEVYRIAAPGRGVDISLEDKVKITEIICLMYDHDEYTLGECCKKVGITERTFFNWRANISEISDLYLEADKKKEIIYRHKLRERARTNAERLMDGYTIELTEREAEPVTDSEGNVVMRTTKIKKKEVFVRPSVKMTETALFNVDPRNFERNPKPVEKINQDVDIDPIEWVD